MLLNAFSIDSKPEVFINFVHDHFFYFSGGGVVVQKLFMRKDPNLIISDFENQENV